MYKSYYYYTISVSVPNRHLVLIGGKYQTCCIANLVNGSVSNYYDTVSTAEVTGSRMRCSNDHE